MAHKFVAQKRQFGGGLGELLGLGSFFRDGAPVLYGYTVSVGWVERSDTPSMTMAKRAGYRCAPPNLQWLSWPVGNAALLPTLRLGTVWIHSKWRRVGWSGRSAGWAVLYKYTASAQGVYPASATPAAGREPAGLPAARKSSCTGTPFRSLATFAGGPRASRLAGAAAAFSAW